MLVPTFAIGFAREVGLTIPNLLGVPAGFTILMRVGEIFCKALHNSTFVIVINRPSGFD